MHLSQLTPFTLVLLAGLSQATTVQKRSDGDIRVHYNPRIAVPPTLQDPSRRSNVDLFERQSTCGIGRVACSNGGCCSGSCCANGCCPLGYTCSIIDNIPGCCPVGRICGSELGGCTSSSLVPCANYDHCCPRGETCYLDNGRAACSGSDDGNDNGGYTSTYTSWYEETSTSTYVPEPTTTKTSTPVVLTTSSRSTTTSRTSTTTSRTSTFATIASSTPDLPTSGSVPRMADQVEDLSRAKITFESPLVWNSTASFSETALPFKHCRYKASDFSRLFSFPRDHLKGERISIHQDRGTNLVFGSRPWDFLNLLAKLLDCGLYRACFGKAVGGSSSSSPIPSYSPPTSPSPSRLPKPKGNRLVKSPEAQKRGKSPVRPPRNERRISLQSGSTTGGEPPAAGLSRSTSLSVATYGSTPTINVSYASGGSPNVNRSMVSASTSNMSFSPSASPSPNNPSQERLGSYFTNTIAPPPSAGYQARWTSGTANIPASQSAIVGEIDPATGLATFPNSLSDSQLLNSAGAGDGSMSLVPPQGLEGPLQMREAMLRAMENERVVSMGMGNGLPAPVSSNSSQLNSLLEASGLLTPKHRQRLDSVTSSSSWSTAQHLGKNNSVGTSSTTQLNPSVHSHVEGDQGIVPSNASSDQVMANGTARSIIEMDEESRMESRQPLNSTSTTSLPSANVKDQEAGSSSQRKSSIRSSIRSFRNPFSFSRSASTSAATPKREKSKERSGRSKEKHSSMNEEMPSALSATHRNWSSDALLRNRSDTSLTMPTLNTTTGDRAQQRDGKIPLPPKLDQSTSKVAGEGPASPGLNNAFGYPPPLPLPPTSTPQKLLKSTNSPSQASPQSTAPCPTSPTPGTSSRFGFLGRSAVRHSIDSPASLSKGTNGIHRNENTVSHNKNNSIGGQPSHPSVLNGGRHPIQTPYVNGSRERLPLPSPFGERFPVVGGVHPNPPGRGSPAFTAYHMGRMSPAYGMPNASGIAVTGLMRPPGLDPHIELDEVSLRTASGYGFGGIRIDSNGIMLSPIEDEPPPASNIHDDTELHDDESEVQGLLQAGVFEGEYESTEGHTIIPQDEHTDSWDRSQQADDSLVDPNLHGNPSQNERQSQGYAPSLQRLALEQLDSSQPGRSLASPEPEPYPYPTAFPIGSPDTSDEMQPAQLASMHMPQGSDVSSNVFTTVQGESSIQRESSQDSNVERSLLSDLAKQLQRVVGKQSTTSLPRGGLNPNLGTALTPSSVLRLESGENTPVRNSDGEVTEGLDEWGRWNLDDLKNAVGRMKDMIDEQERRMIKKYGHAYSASKNSFGSIPLSPPIDTFEGSVDKSGREDFPFPASRKESQASTTATASTTALVTPTSPLDLPAFPTSLSSSDFNQLSLLSSGGITTKHTQGESLEFTSLDPDLLAMLSPNHLRPATEQDAQSGADSVKVDAADIMVTRSSASSNSFPSRPDGLGSNSVGSNEMNHSVPPSQSKPPLVPKAERPPTSPSGAPMEADMTIMTVASDGFGSIRSDRSVEEILLQRRFGTEADFGLKSFSTDVHNGFDALDLEPVATSSPPKARGPPTPRASSALALTGPTSNNLPIRDRPLLSPPQLQPVAEWESSSPGKDSPVKLSPSRSSPSKLRKERPSLSALGFKDQDQDKSDSDGRSSIRKLFGGSQKNTTRHDFPSSSPTPSSRTRPAAMLADLGHGRPSSALEDGNALDRMKRSLTISNPPSRALSFEEHRHSRLNSMSGIRNGRLSLESSNQARTSLDINLGPRTARAFAAAGVLDSPTTSNFPSGRTPAWRSVSAMGYRRDGLDRDYGRLGGTRSLASSPIPTSIIPTFTGGTNRRVSNLNEMHRGIIQARNRSGSDSWSRSIMNRTPEGAFRSIAAANALTEPSSNSSPTSTHPSRTIASSSMGSSLPNGDGRTHRVPSDANSVDQQTAIQLLRERHELEKEALLTALGEAKKASKREKAEKDELKAELREMGVYVEELETKLGEAIAKIRWMEKEISSLKGGASARELFGPQRKPDASVVKSEQEKSITLWRSSDGHSRERTSFDHHADDSRMDSSPANTTIYITREPASPTEAADHSRDFPMDMSRSRDRGHQRLSSDASSIIVPRMDHSMSMLLQEKGYTDAFDGSSLYSAHDGSPPPSPTLVLGKMTNRLSAPTQSDRTFLTSPPSGLPHTPSRPRKANPPSTIMEMSPTTTTADYSIAPGSPGSLVLRPEDERHLDDLLSFIGHEDGL
ncbi:hypothetical protein CPB86DRAFT_819162 [Serendipita vermifera]|nr:hypothetical protein CPB86DRAFT_819162 [Serendipita vermifera]